MNALSVIIGVALVIVSCAGFWYLLPRNGKVHPLVEKWDGGSMLTLVLMCTITLGFVLVLEALLV